MRSRYHDYGGDKMSTFTRLLSYLSGTSVHGDREFESYYGGLLMHKREGGPSAAEARRDYEPVRRVIDRAVIF